MPWIYVPDLPSEAPSSRPSASPEPCATSRLTTTVSDSSNSGSQTGGSPTRQSGMTCVRSTGDPGVDSWTSSLAASRASRGRSQASAKEPPTPAIFGPTSSGLLARYDPDWCWWRTSQGSLLSSEEDLEREQLATVMSSRGGLRRLNRAPSDALLETFPRSGTTRNGMLYPLRGLGLHTSGSGSGLWPTATSSTGGPTWTGDQGNRLARAALTFPTPRTCAGKRSSGSNRTEFYRAMWPTPSASMMTGADMEQARYAGSNPERPSYEEAGKKFPTPSAEDAGRKGSVEWAERWANGEKVPRPQQRLRTKVAQAGGSLNPGFVEWLMGWPHRWSSLEPLPVADWSAEEGPWANGEWPGVPRVAKGVEDRVARLRTLGNGWVPQVAAVVGERILNVIDAADLAAERRAT